MLDLMCDMLVSCWSGFSLLNYFFWFCSRNVMMSLPVFQFKQGKKVVYGCSELFNASQFIKQVSHNTPASQNQWLHLEPHGCLNGPTQTKYVFGILTVETVPILFMIEPLNDHPASSSPSLFIHMKPHWKCLLFRNDIVTLEEVENVYFPFFHFCKTLKTYLIPEDDDCVTGTF